MMSRFPVGLMALLLGVFGPAFSFGAGHQAALQPYVKGPPPLTLSQADRTALRGGNAVFKSFNSADDNRTAIVFRVAAPTSIVWSVITDFDAYPQWIKMVKETEVYKREQHDIYVRFEISHWLLGRYTYYMRHFFPWRQKSWGVWQLDENQASDFTAAIGFWRVIPVVGNAEHSDVIYSADLRFKAAKPQWLRRFVVKRSLKQATRWVKQQAEARWR